MHSKSLKFRGRQVYLMDLEEKLPNSFEGKFVVLLPAYNDQEVLIGKTLASALLDAGCSEFCCVGARAEELHDRIDEVIEDREEFDVVTTFHDDVVEACEYFLFAAGAAQPSLIAMVSDHVEIKSCLESLIAGTD